MKVASTVRRGGKGTPYHVESPALLYNLNIGIISGANGILLMSPIGLRHYVVSPYGALERVTIIVLRIHQISVKSVNRE